MGGYLRVGLGVCIAAGVPFAQGALIELGAPGTFHGWGGILLRVGIPWLIVLLAAITLAVRGEMHLAVASFTGLSLGFLAGAFLLAGDFAPYLLELGGRELTDFGDKLEFGWDWVLLGLLVLVGAFGATAGAVCAPLVWAFKRRLAG